MKINRLIFSFLIIFVFSGQAYAGDYNGAVQAKVILKATKTVTGQDIRYLKTDNPEVTVLDVVLPPGAETGWHIHPVPVYAYVLSGTLEVRTEDGKSNRFKEGDAIIEAVNTPHNGKNIGTTLVHLVVFYTGEVGKPVTVKMAVH